MSDKDRIEYIWSQRPSPFDVENFGVKKDPGKDYRWVDPNKAETRKNRHGFSPVKPSQSTSDGMVKSEGMILMERPKELAEKSRKYKEALTRSRTQAVKSRLDEEAERLSEKHGTNMHKYFYSDKDDN